MRLDWLRAFRAVMLAGTVTGAAAIILRTQPQVSRMIAGLEASLGLRLFEREGRRLVPTQDGLQFFQHIEPLLAGLDGVRGAAQDIKNRRGQPLVIAAEPFLLHALVPDAIVALSRADGFKCAIDICVRGLGLWMSRSNADLGIVALPFSQTDMDRTAFAEAELVAVLPQRHRLAKRKALAMADLRGERFIALRPSTLLRAQIDLSAAREGVSLDPVIETASGVTACGLATSGLGITIADPIVAASFRPAGAVLKRLTTPLRLTYGFLTPKGVPQAGPMLDAMRTIAALARRLGAGLVRVDPPWGPR